MGSTIFDEVTVLYHGDRHYYPNAEAGRATERCEKCGVSTMIVLAYSNSTAWLVCHCGRGYVRRVSTLYPAARPLSAPAGLPADVATAWNEARDCLSVGAYTGTAMLCRKILFHVAVDEGLEPADAKGFAPTFKACVDHLENEGIITARMRKWVEHVKDVGNEANHDLTAIDREGADRLATFVHQLLQMHYGTKAALESLAPLPEPDGSVEGT